MKTMPWVNFVLAISSLGALPPALWSQEAATAQAPAQNVATTPVPKTGAWMQRHDRINSRAKGGDVDLLFIGDSITQGWETAAPSGGKDVWAKYYGDRKAMNAGISGDQTQHVLWRLDNGNIDGIHPKLAVIMIGTNNVPERSQCSADDIAAGIQAIVGRLREKLPETKILLLAIFPRSDRAAENDAMKQKIDAANQTIAKLADGKMIYFMDINSKFLDADGKIQSDVMRDSLHPNAKGYEIWAEAIEPRVAELMVEKK